MELDPCLACKTYRENITHFNVRLKYEIGIRVHDTPCMYIAAGHIIRSWTPAIVTRGAWYKGSGDEPVSSGSMSLLKISRSRVRRRFAWCAVACTSAYTTQRQ